MYFEDNTIIHCKTRKEAEQLIKITNSSEIFINSWNHNKEKTCYKIKKGKIETYCYIHYFMLHNYKIIEFSDIVIQELSTEEVLQTLTEICNTFINTANDCKFTDCPLKNNDMCCIRNLKHNSKEIIEICTKWKYSHMKESKEPKTEWVNVCKIYNALNKCVHKEDITDISEFAHYSAVEKKAEVIFKNYIKTHNGHYTMVIEHICKTKD